LLLALGCFYSRVTEFGSLATMRVGVSAIIMDKLSSLFRNMGGHSGNPFQRIKDLTCRFEESVASIVWQ
jgi:hypothetical protein